MKEASAKVQIQVCQDDRCCKSNVLDNPSKKDFQFGTTAFFSSGLLGTCNGFLIEPTKKTLIKITNSGNDGVGFEFVNIVTNSYQKIRCSVKVVVKNTSKTVHCLQKHCDKGAVKIDDFENI